MASTIDFSNLTLNTAEAKDSSEMVFEKTLLAPELSLIHEVMTGVEMDRYIPILGRYAAMGKLNPGSCAVNAVTSQIPVSQKTWTPKLISGRVSHCQDDVPQLLKAWKRSRIAAKTWEDVDNEMIAFIEDRLSDAIYESILRITSFGNTGASPVGDATGDELLTAGADKGLFTMLDGLWAQIIENQVNGTEKGYRYTISKNSEASKTAQLNLATDATFDAMQAMYNNISAEAIDSGDLVFQMTRTMYNNYLATLTNASKAFTLENIKKGTTDIGFLGVPIIVRNDWDRNIKAFQNLGATYYLPNRILLSSIGNIPIGTSDTESLSSFESFYDQKDKTHYMDFAYKLDVKLLLDDQYAVAY